MEFTKKSTCLFIAALVALIVAGVLFYSSSAVDSPDASPEVAVSELSPSGEVGGRIVPASCSSYEHYPGECSPPSFTARNSENNPTTSVTITNGKSVTLDWACQSSSSSSSSNFSTGGAPSGSTSLAPTTTTTYTVVCSNGGSGSVTVAVINPALSITAAPSRVRSGSAATISWTTTLTNSCTVTGPGVSRTGTSGSVSTGPIANRSTYALSCQTDGGAVSSNVVVNIAPRYEEI